MILLVLSAAAGFASLPLWPPPWQSGIALGWGLGMLVEMVLARRRARLLRGRPGANDLLALVALGFLGKLFLIATGAILGAATDWYLPEAYGLAFLAAVFLGEAVGLSSSLLRAPPPADPSPPPPPERLRS